MIDKQDIPDRWSLVDFEEAVDILDSRREPINSEEREKRTNGVEQSDLYPYYGAGGQIGWIDDYIFDDELILLAEDGATTGYVYMVDGKSWINNHTHVLKENPDIIKKMFLYYYLRHYDFDHLKTGGTRPKLTQTNMKKVKIPVPPLSEQEEIVEVVEKRLKRMERLKKSVGDISRLTKEYEDSLLTFLTIGKNITGKDTVGGIPKQQNLPDGWDLVQLSKVADVNPRISYDEQEDYAYVPMDAVSADEKTITRYERRESLYSGLAKFSEDDIIVARITPCFENGKMAVASELPSGYEFAVGSTEFVVIRPDEIDPEYLFTYLKSPIVRQWGEHRLLGATGRERIKISQFRDELSVPVPPKETQSQITQAIKENDFSKIRTSVISVQSMFEEYENSVLANATRGNI